VIFIGGKDMFTRKMIISLIVFLFVISSPQARSKEKKPGIDELLLRIEALEKRVHVAEDIEAIKQLQNRYVNHLSFSEMGMNEIVDCFTDDAKIEVGPPVSPGKEGIAVFFQTIKPGHSGREGNFVVHPIIKVNGDNATGKWLIYMMYSYQLTGQMLFWMQGVYDMEYKRVNGEWKISSMKWTRRIGPDAAPPFPGTGN
jgi:hypothetical protein